MRHDSKPRYACPQCGTKMNEQVGSCPKCGFIGGMEHKDMYLKGTNAAGKPIVVDPETVIQDAIKQKKAKAPDTTPQYKCPRCNATTSKAHGRCPNHRSCGYFGPMKTSTMGKPKPK